MNFPLNVPNGVSFPLRLSRKSLPQALYPAGGLPESQDYGAV